MKLQVGVKALIKNDQGQYLFLLRTKVMNGENSSHWDIPGGRIEPEEALVDALKREILEETGMSIDAQPKLIGAQDIFAGTDLHVVRLTYTLDADGEVIVSDEHQDAKWVTLEVARTFNLDPYLKETLESRTLR